MNYRSAFTYSGSTLIFLFFWLICVAPVQAQVLIASDCSAGLKNNFLDNEPVCALVRPSCNILFGSAQICVVPPGATSSGADVTPGGCNAVACAFLDEPFLWLPPTTPGSYDVILVQSDGGFARDSIFISSSGGAAPTVDVGAIKSAAGKQKTNWEKQAAFGAHLSDNATAFALAWAAATGDVLGVVVNTVSLVTGIPTDYNAGVLTVGGKVIAGLAGQQAAKYRDLEADPPDPLFTDFIAIDLAALNAELAVDAALYPGANYEYPFTNKTDDPLNIIQVQLSNRMAEETALVRALMRAFEKYQGADQAGNDEYTLLQAQAVKEYADMLVSQLSKTVESIKEYKNELDDHGLANEVYDGAELADIIARLQNIGLDEEEEEDLRSLGWTNADIDFLFARINAFPAPSGLYNRDDALNDIIDSSEEMKTAAQELSLQAQEVVTYFTLTVSIEHPTADASGPYTQDQGVALEFDGSGSSDPTGQILTYEWDFDLDGEFDDAIGLMPSTIFTAVGSFDIGLRVTDPDGNYDIAYASVQIDPVNRAPQITSFLPAALDLAASSLTPLEFSATATDADLDPLSFQWEVDGQVMGNTPDFTYTPLVGETGIRVVKLTVSDQNPLSNDAIETRTVTLVIEVLVPNVVGLSQAAAEAAIVAEGLTVGEVTTGNSDTVPRGDVISQDPPAGTELEPGSAVNILVSLGVEPVAVPEVVGLTQAEAEAAIVASGLAVGNIDNAYSATIGAGNVISQDPTAGTELEPGAAVNIVVSLGVELVAVPGVVGMSQTAAEGAIAAAGLTVGNVDTAYSDTIAQGSVISQNPVPGSAVALGSSVDLLVSLGPNVQGPVIGDLDGDFDVDRDDISLIVAAFNTPALGTDDPRDVDGDGMITILDIRKMVLICTRPRCATN